MGPNRIPVCFPCLQKRSVSYTGTNAFEYMPCIDCRAPTVTRIFVDVAPSCIHGGLVSDCGECRAEALSAIRENMKKWILPDPK